MAGQVLKNTLSIARAPRVLRQAAYVLAILAGYYVLAYVGTVLHLPPSSNAIVWLATAFLAGVLYLTPVRHWWAILLGLVPTHLYLVGHIEARQPSLMVALTQIAGNFALAAVTVVVIRRVSRGPARFDTFRAMLTFILVAGVGVTAGMSALILCAHQVTGWSHEFWLSWRQWMLASVFPAVTLTPLVVLTARPVEVGAGASSRGEAMIVSAALFLVSFLAFGQVGGAFGPTLCLAPFPLLLWAAARCGVWGVCLSLLVAGAAIVLRALDGVGPFATSAAAIDVVSLQVYLIAISIPFLLLASLMEERRSAEERLRRSEARMEIAAATTETGLWQWRPDGGELWMTEHCRAMFGLNSDRPHTVDAFLDAIHSHDRARVAVALGEALAGRPRNIRAFRVLGQERDERWIIIRTHVELDDRGRVACVSGAFRDITQQLASQRESEQLTKRLQTLQEDERKQIAGALHDSTAQHIVGIGLVMGMLERRLALTEEIRPLFDDVRNLVGEATKELRTFTYLLRPPDLERQDLGVVLRNYVTGFALRTGLDVKVRMSDVAADLPIEDRRALLRVAQEALANVHRHAAATRVTVDLRRSAGELHLVIRDDGRGITAASGDTGAASAGVGIPGMRARIRELGGRINIRSSAKGTVVHAALRIARTPAPRHPLREGAMALH